MLRLRKGGPLLLSLLLLLTLACLKVEEKEEPIPLWAEDFESTPLGEVPGDFQVVAGGYGSVSVVSDPSNPNNKVLLLDDTSLEGRVEATFEFPLEVTRTLTVEFRVLFDREEPYAWNNCHCCAYTGMEFRSGNSRIVGVMGDETGTRVSIANWDREKLMDTQLGQWEKVKVVFTYSDGGSTTIQYYVNGVLAFTEDKSAANKVDNIRLVTSNTRTCRVYVDDLRLFID